MHFCGLQVRIQPPPGLPRETAPIRLSGVPNHPVTSPGSSHPPHDSTYLRSEDTPTPSPTETGYTADADGEDEDDNFIAECLKGS